MSLNEGLIQKRCQDIGDSLKRLEKIKEVDMTRFRNMLVHMYLKIVYERMKRNKTKNSVLSDLKGEKNESKKIQQKASFEQSNHC
jgi:uncharacterized protein YutE (UPF0331/DUF86 family)